MPESLELYRRQLEGAPKLTNEWFEPVLKDYHNKSETAKNSMLLASLPLVVDFVLSRRQQYRLPELDLIQEGNLALTRALETFAGLDVFAYMEHVNRCLDDGLARFRLVQ